MKRWPNLLFQAEMTWRRRYMICFLSTRPWARPVKVDAGDCNDSAYLVPIKVISAQRIDETIFSPATLLAKIDPAAVGRAATTGRQRSKE